MVLGVSGGILYFGIALAAWPGFAFLLRWLGRPQTLVPQLAVAAAMALLWPLTLSLGSFGGVAIARLIGTSSKKAKTASGDGADVSPAAASF